MTVEYFQVANSSIETVIQGTGDSVFMLPGAGVDITIFDKFASILSGAGFRSVALNLRGVAGSIGPLEGLSLHDFAADVAGVIEAMNEIPAHILGAAFGNRVARCLAVDRPELVRTTILLAAGGLVQPQPDAATALRQLLRPDLTTEERRRASRVALVSPASDPNIVLRMKLWPAAVAAQVSAVEATPLEDWWASGDAPILVIQGLDDRIAPPANGRALKNQLGERVQLVEIAGAGHALTLEKPDAVAEAVITFLRNH